MTLPPSNATLGPNIGQLLPQVLLFHPKQDIFSPENAIFSRKQSSFLTNGWHFPTNYATLSQKEHFSDKYLPFSLKNTARHSSTGHFLPSTPRFLPKDPFSHQKYHTCPPREVSLSHNCPLFSHVLVIFSQKYHISLGNWACASKKMVFSPRHTCFLQTTARFLPKRLDDKTKLDTCNQE